MKLTKHNVEGQKQIEELNVRTSVTLDDRNMAIIVLQYAQYKTNAIQINGFVFHPVDFFV